MTYTDKFLELITLYRTTPIEFEALKPASIAMWILESGRGASNLAGQHLNFAGMKWREEMGSLASRIHYQAHDGWDHYCGFQDLSGFIKGFWAFLDRSPYQGWRTHADDPEAFVRFVGPIWAENPAYVERVLGLMEEAQRLAGG